MLDEVRLDRPFAPKIEEVFTRIDEKNAALLAARESDDPEVRASVRGKRPTGPSTKQRIKATIRTVPADAVRDHLVSFNAASLYHLVAFRGLRRQQAEKLAWGSSWKETGRIFTQEDGSELTPDWVSEHFWRLVFAAGLPPIRIHDLRHGACRGARCTPATSPLPMETEVAGGRLVRAAPEHFPLKTDHDPVRSLLKATRGRAGRAPGLDRDVQRGAGSSRVYGV